MITSNDQEGASAKDAGSKDPRIAMLDKEAEEERLRTDSNTALAKNAPAGSGEIDLGSLISGQLKFKMQTAFGGSTPVFSDSSKQFAEMLAARSSGRIRLEIFSSGEIVGALELLEAVKVGVLDFGWTSLNYYSGEDRATAPASTCL